MTDGPALRNAGRRGGDIQSNGDLLIGSDGVRRPECLARLQREPAVESDRVPELHRRHGTTHTTVGCGTLPSQKVSPTNVAVTLTGLAAGTYTFTVRVTLTDGGKAGAASAAFTITGPSPAVDQSNVFGGDDAEPVGADGLCAGVFTDLGQSFTAGRTGSLTQVSLAGIAGAPSSLVLTVYGADAQGLPTGPSLGGGTYTGTGASDSSELFDIPLAQSAALTAGRRYVVTWTIADCAGNVGRTWLFTGSGSTGDKYIGGTALAGNNGVWAPESGGLDFYFQTWMT
jgi:hypothetical protein